MVNHLDLSQNTREDLINIIINLRNEVAERTADLRRAEDIFKSYKKSIDGSLYIIKEECKAKAKMHLEAVIKLRENKNGK